MAAQMSLACLHNMASLHFENGNVTAAAEFAGHAEELLSALSQRETLISWMMSWSMRWMLTRPSLPSARHSPAAPQLHKRVASIGIGCACMLSPSNLNHTFEAQKEFVSPSII